MPDGKNKQHLAAKAGSLFDMLPCQAIPEPAGDHYGRLKAEAETKAGDARVNGNAKALQDVLGSLDTFDFWFNIVTVNAPPKR
jgi:hypothetical protein